jgi:hypothetical protein
MNMYIAQAKNGRFDIVEELGAIDPQEAVVPNDATLSEKGVASCNCYEGCSSGEARSGCGLGPTQI